jgi:hypothetical protein
LYKKSFNLSGSRNPVNGTETSPAAAQTPLTTQQQTTTSPDMSGNVDRKKSQEQPKYKRTEFMRCAVVWLSLFPCMVRPKLGAVNLDVIDAVQARLTAVSGEPAAASSSAGGNASQQCSPPAARGTRDQLFRSMRVETSVDNGDEQRASTHLVGHFEYVFIYNVYSVKCDAHQWRQFIE